MLNSKQRSNLRAAASTIEPIFQLGKTSVDEESGEFTETFLSSVDDALEARELIKLTVLKNAAFSARELGDDLAAKLSAECVATIGRKIILYRYSNKKNIKHLEF
ncbi:MAG: YhbY family RNA-binding protein [Clostridia bacterium]|nr:YhbY family RNA-binding protein [Clostridia bacterium]MBQ9480895.1 YhbY family RNA-binding protein [Clostridia bacterium]